MARYCFGLLIFENPKAWINEILFQVVGGALNGEVAYCQLPNLEALCKVNG